MITILRGLAKNLTKTFPVVGRGVRPAGVIKFHFYVVHRCEVKADKNNELESGNLAADALKQKNDRTQVIPVETSIRYLQSSAYKETYGDQFVWEQYRRNHKGAIPPRKTRKTCVRKGVISTGNPCPICRDEYLALDHRNIELLRQFISPHTGKILSYSKTGLCQRKHFELLVAVERAYDYGLISFDVPFRKFDLDEYYGHSVTKAQ
ncbi:PREDICTED: 28S ribosomal protein S18b, mitochondrial [Rhagoletis zephyria]|uniref:28S ribosomal protein S18b, mitochondrial n=1 Tax=Rhagoletis zephyria TaxID=28612 RepID=UPI00081192E1|nr:PREDICTED: 28S ribosomal protein S18b, mitochondrial [Rhagoletis zephyria]XP_036320795.1 28S ribosomal protein S18b, mitochondrial [Rhagoletis pomonella]